MALHKALVNVRIRHSSCIPLHNTVRHVSAVQHSGVFGKAVSQNVEIYNSLSKHKSCVQHADADYITWYTCGPTVYDSAHLGHARTYVTLDILRRLMEYVTRKPVLFAMNVTDIDDKIITRAKERKVSHDSIAKQYEAEFWHDMQSLNVGFPTVITRVTEYIPHIISYIDKIIGNKQAYAAADGVYFDTEALKGQYGKLMPAGYGGPEAVEGGTSPHKRSNRDFALWKCTESEPFWNSPWGKGRPGWHIECSAMVHGVFGDHVHLHSGGVDLAFPHHCNEIAQAEAYHGFHSCNLAATPWVDVFLHTGHLHIEGRKMSKSLKNFITIREMIATAGSSASDIFRVYCLSNHYRSNIAYGDDRLVEARSLLARLSNTWQLLQAARTSAGAVPWDTKQLAIFKDIASLTAQIEAALRDDFDTPSAMQHLFSLCTLFHARQPQLHPSIIHTISMVLERYCTVFGLQSISAPQHTQMDRRAADTAFATAAADFRHTIRAHAITMIKASKGSPELQSAAHDAKATLKLCDEFRDGAMKAAGWELKDSPQGYTLLRSP